MTVADMTARMANAEFIEWQIFHARKGQRRDLEHKMSQSRR